MAADKSGQYLSTLLFAVQGYYAGIGHYQE
jgi:hypothetical protein